LRSCRKAAVESGAAVPQDVFNFILSAPDQFLALADPEFMLEINVERVDRKVESATRAAPIELVPVHLPRPFRVMADFMGPARIEIAALGFLVLGIGDNVPRGW